MFGGEKECTTAGEPLICQNVSKIFRSTKQEALKGALLVKDACLKDRFTEVKIRPIDASRLRHRSQWDGNTDIWHNVAFTEMTDLKVLA